MYSIRKSATIKECYGSTTFNIGCASRTIGCTASIDVSLKFATRNDDAGVTRYIGLCTFTIRHTTAKDTPGNGTARDRDGAVALHLGKCRQIFLIGLGKSSAYDIPNFPARDGYARLAFYKAAWGCVRQLYLRFLNSFCIVIAGNAATDYRAGLTSGNGYIRCSKDGGFTDSILIIIPPVITQATASHQSLRDIATADSNLCASRRVVFPVKGIRTLIILLAHHRSAKPVGIISADHVTDNCAALDGDIGLAKHNKPGSFRLACPGNDAASIYFGKGRFLSFDDDLGGIYKNFFSAAYPIRLTAAVDTSSVFLAQLTGLFVVGYAGHILYCHRRTAMFD